MNFSKTTTRRLLLVLCCVLLLAGAGGTVYVIRKQRVRAEFMAMRTEGMRAAASSTELDKAVDLLGRYLHRYPEDVDALVEYARVRPLVKSQDRQYLRDTMLVLRHLLTLRPEMTDQRRALLRLYADFGYASEAVATADEILKTQPTDGEALGVRATSLARMRRLDDAYKAAQAWARVAPTDIDAQILIVEMMQAKGKPKGEIRKWAEDLDEDLTDPASFDLVRGVVAAASDEPQSAMEWYGKAAAEPSADRKIKHHLIVAYDNLGQHAKSLELLKKLVKEFGDPIEQRFLIRRLWELESWAELLTYPIAPGSELSTDRELKAMVGTALAKTGKVDQAKAIATELSGSSQDPVSVAWGAVLNQILAPETTDYRKYLEACLAGLKDSPGNAYLRCFVGQAYSHLGEGELALANFQGAAQQNGTWAAPLVYSSAAYLAQGRQEQAFDAARGGVMRSNGFGAALAWAVAWNANIESGRRSNDAELSSLLTDIEGAAPQGYYVLPERVASLVRGNKKGEALAVIDKALGATPPPSDSILYRLAAVSRLHGLGVDARIYKRIEEKGEGPTASLALSRGIAAFVAGDKNVVVQFEESRRRSGKGDTLEWQLVAARLLDFTCASTAQAAWVALADAHPEDLSVQQLALAARAPRSDRNFVERTVERVKRLSGGEGVQWRVARARWLLDKTSDRRHVDPKAVQEASILLGDVLRIAPDAMEARVLQAKSLDLLGNPSAAIEQLTNIVKLNPSMQGATLYLVNLLSARGDSTKAREYLDRVTQSGIQDQSNRQLTARLLAQQGEPSEAIKLLQDNAESDDDAEILLASLYRQQNKLKEAEDICRKRLQKPDVATVALAVDLYGAMGRPAEEVRKIAALLKGLDVEPGAEELLLAEYAARYGSVQEALEFSRLATQRAPKNPNAWKALALTSFAADKLLEGIGAIESGLKAIPGDPYLQAVADAKPLLVSGMAVPVLKPLAMDLARSPETPGAREALQILTSPGGANEDLAKQLGRLKQIADRYPLNLTLQNFTAERLLVAAGDQRSSESNRKQWREEALAITTRTAQTFPLSSEAARMAANTLLNAERWPEAVLFAKAWRQRSGNATLEPDFVAATALMKQELAAEAKAQLAGYFPAVLKNADKNAGVVCLYVEALYRSGAPDEAERILLPALTSSEAVRMTWIARYRELPEQEAATWLTRVAGIAGGDSLAVQIQLTGALTNLGQKTHNEDLLVVARQMRGKMVQRTDLRPWALAVLGSQFEEDRDLPGAEKLYRQALAGDATLAVAKNNLAMVLVQRGGDLREATALANEAIASNPGVPNFYETLARVLAKAGETDHALEKVRKAAALDPEHLTWQASTVEILADAGRFQDAAKALSELEAALKTKGKLDAELNSRLEVLRQKISTATKTVSAVPN